MTKDEIIKQLRDMAKHPTVTLPRDCEALRAAADLLAQPEQEPVAFICQGNAYMADDVDEYCTAEHTPLYTTPPQRTWVGLTDEEFQYCVELKNPESIAEEVEAKLKEKNT